MDKISEELTCSNDNILYPIHGGNRQAALKGLDVPDEHVIDFSASVNPLGPSPGVLQVLGSVGPDLAEYPDPDCILLCEKISDYLNISLDQVLVTNGSTELIHLLPRLLGRRKQALILNPCFSEYERVFRLNKIHTHSLDYDAEEKFQMNPERVVSHLRKHPEIDMLVLGHPNNPTGHVWDEDSLDTLIQHCNSQKIILVIDETFIEFCDGVVSALKWSRNNQHLVVIRSMTKFFGLAGVRLGYGVMRPDLRVRLKRYQIPWSVNAIAQKMGVAALEGIKDMQSTKDIVRERRQFLSSELSGLQGVRVFPSRANFLLFQLIDSHAEAVHQFYVGLMKDGILIRNCGNFTGLDKSYFRVALRAGKENVMLISRIKAQLGKDY
jgi:threonine-phosphate decarboxylase